MIWICIEVYVFIALLDLCFGNRVFPGRVGVVEEGGRYMVYKMHRFGFIPFKKWLKYNDTDRRMDNFSSKRWGAYFNDIDTAIAYAKVYSNQVSEDPSKEVWTSKRSKVVKKENRDDLLEQLGRAVILKEPQEEIERLSKLIDTA